MGIYWKGDIAKVKKFKVNLESAVGLMMVKIGLLVQNQAKINAPYLSGTLRRSISADISDANKGMVIVGSPVAYARIREFQNNKNPTRKFYLKRAYSENKSEIQKIINNALKSKLG